MRAAMDSVTVRAYISAPREDVFDLLEDLSVRPSFTDHYWKDYRLANPRTKGIGASARYLVAAPVNRHYVETRAVVAERPRRLVEATHGGRGGRSTGETIFELSRQGRTLTEVEMTVWFERGTLRERVVERLGTRSWMRRRSKKALERLRMIFEEPGRHPVARASVAGFEPLKSPRFGMSLPSLRR